MESLAGPHNQAGPLSGLPYIGYNLLGSVIISGQLRLQAVLPDQLVPLTELLGSMIG